MLQAKPDWMIEQGAPVGPQLYRILRERVIRNDLPPGSRISESEIAAGFAVSRQPVREAFIKLAEEGLLEVRPQRGTFVRKISTAAVMDARFVREAVEADVVKLLAETPDPALARELTGQLVEQRKAVADKDVHRFLECDERFHRTLAEAAGKARAWHVVEGLKSQMDRVRYMTAAHFPMHKLIEQHTAIAQTIAAGDKAGAETAMRGHLREILNDLPAIVGDRPEYFEDADR
ncbi:GntR family transcriptional regulator [Nitratireductor sp. ZSWI3]|uniref:GntR family transcriptional regulator n=1 Tax=Nitratireductor sp. ZSWI3 TaxID=2966359 RepID=UPI00215007FF|nr:GntR family transcriptional regulator [Nitratireductor sp. ZSWI3]MCR4264627.1 GntR family transcriptional regulator [Nitratireductor sp. ZSWI3]